MNREDIMATVVAVVVDKLNVSPQEVVLTAHFANDLGADSLDQVELVMELERAFDVHIKDDEAAKLQTVGSVVDYLEKTLAQRKT
ncbi:MAG: acyl carrier protein [Candidatus Cardinium sp.]|uniref:acyl carrier protein n=1 Tax=Cardinium endosymbiont of Dermatophagoides farinae TaxID=2597823 RepID=UPI001182A164|nr:acyl carrier protein [Cardinium endosymbiont of Dermatophagoides farinae]TSJ80576.1 acyl carrier protein [Cardinium endosymbiont of Dermatophagoides farinae]UWW96565.1 MAG: acyl carrier protein [Candidatus Cardinium sp.]